VIGSQVGRRVGLVLLLVAAVTTRCGGGRGQPAEATPEAEWSLTVTNRHWLDVTVYVIYDTQRNRVGTVTAASAETFVLPSHTIGSGRTIRFEANAIGSRERAVSEPLAVRAGQHVQWVLESGLARSSVAVR
jgi:flagella basal body P-ring formation protein FlgA